MKDHEIRQWIEELRSRLPGEVPRFSAAGVPMSQAWSPESLKIEPAEQANFLDLEFNQHSITGEFHDEFYEEAHSLREQVEAGLSPEADAVWPDTWHPVSDSRARKVIALWETFAIPVRYRGGRVYRIWSPMRTFAEPIVKSMPAEEFVYAAASYTPYTNAELVRSRTEIERLKNTVTILALLAGIFLVLLVI